MTDVAPENENELFDAILGGGAARLGRGRDGSTRPVSPAPARDRASKPETATAASLASKAEVEAPSQTPSAKPTSSPRKNPRRQSTTPTGSEDATLGSPMTGNGRRLDLYVSADTKQALLDVSPMMSKTDAVYIAVELFGKKVAADHPALKVGTMFPHRIRPRRQVGSVANPTKVRIALHDDAAVTLGKLIDKSSLAASAFIEECLTRWIAAGKPQPGA